MLKRLLSSVFLCFALVFGTVSAASGVSYTVKYDCGIGTGTMTAGTATGGSLYTPKASQCTPPTGSHFAGWTVENLGDRRYPEQPFVYNYGTPTVFVAKYHKGKFSVETGQIAANGTFSFTMSAKGTFTVLCNDNGTLTGTGVQVDGETIVRSNTTQDTYTCTYPAAGSHIVFFDSTSVTEYSKPSPESFSSDPSTTTVKSPLGFVNNTNVVAIFGSLSNLFPYVSSTYYPRFVFAFYGCTSLWYIPQGLFETITTSLSTQYVFYRTFQGCISLITVPGKLFSMVSVIGRAGFHSTFRNCSNLREIPKGFFANVSISATSQSSLFLGTFAGCTTIRTIPKDLFAGITDTASGVFDSTFGGCSNLESIPAELFMSVNPSTTNRAEELFKNTFKDCTSLTDIEDGLFDGVTRLGTATFQGTFSGCSNLKEIPDLFVNLSNASGSSAFAGTFSGCSKLRVVPEKLFFGVTAGSDNMFKQTFLDCVSLPEVPNGMFGNVASGGSSMFQETFKGCIALSLLPRGLFASINSTSSSHTSMFQETFSGCTSLSIVPYDTFAQIPVGAPSMFQETFAGCTSLTSIGQDGEGLFQSIETTAITDSQMFKGTFNGCSALEYVPSDTFKRIAVGAPSMFASTFQGCTSLRDIGRGLFSYVRTTITQTGSATHMFDSTFYDCTNLRAIPDDLFGGITYAPSDIFRGTFQNCTSVTTVPYRLFNGIADVEDSVFYSTFKGCTGLTTIGAHLFDSLRASNRSRRLFLETFMGCTSLTVLPDGLFSVVETGAESMFESTFEGCTGLIDIGYNVFHSVRTGADDMFKRTFYGCTGLTSLPGGFFLNLGSVAPSIFEGMFQGCTNLSGFIPQDFFGALEANNFPTASNMLLNTFSNTGLLTTCPTHMQNYAPLNTYKNQPWNSGTVKVSCEYMSYQVTYVNGGHSGSLPSPNPTTAQYNTSFRPATNNLTPDTGYSADGWRIQGTNVVIPRGSSITWTYDTPQILEPTFKPNVSGAITLNSDRYANSSASTPVVNATVNAALSPVYSKYGIGVYASRNNANSGTNQITSLTTLPQLTGCTFAGFYTGKAGSGTQVINSSGQYLSAAYTQVPNNNTTATWYANWTQCNVALNWFNEDGTTPVTPSNQAANQCVYDTTVTVPNNTPNKSGYHFVGWCINQPLSSYWSDVQNEILTFDAQHLRWEPSVPFPDGHTMDDEFVDGSTSGGLNPGEWGVTFSTGELLGRTLCSTTSGTYKQTGNPDENIAGDNCWCAGTKYGNSCQISPLSWVYYGNYGVGVCETHCAYWCATETSSYSNGYRAAMFGATQ